jgi:hypothetical protein
MSEFPRVTNVMGGPRELSMPCPLWEAGGRLWGSWPAEADCGEKYEVAEDAVGVEGFVRVARRDRDEAEAMVELVDGRRNSVGASGAVWVRRCFGGEG